MNLITQNEHKVLLRIDFTQSETNKKHGFDMSARTIYATLHLCYGWWHSKAFEELWVLSVAVGFFYYCCCLQLEWHSVNRMILLENFLLFRRDKKKLLQTSFANRVKRFNRFCFFVYHFAQQPNSFVDGNSIQIQLKRYQEIETITYFQYFKFCFCDSFYLNFNLAQLIVHYLALVFFFGSGLFAHSFISAAAFCIGGEKKNVFHALGFCLQIKFPVIKM